MVVYLCGIDVCVIFVLFCVALIVCVWVLRAGFYRFGGGVQFMCVAVVVLLVPNVLWVGRVLMFWC